MLDSMSEWMACGGTKEALLDPDRGYFTQGGGANPQGSGGPASISESVPSIPRSDSVGPFSIIPIPPGCNWYALEAQTRDIDVRRSNGIRTFIHTPRFDCSTMGIIISL